MPLGIGPHFLMHSIVSIVHYTFNKYICFPRNIIEEHNRLPFTKTILKKAQTKPYKTLFVLTLQSIFIGVFLLSIYFTNSFLYKHLKAAFSIPLFLMN